jgi:molybdopterin converting factor small subunit
MTLELRIFKMIETLVLLKDEAIVSKLEETLRQEKIKKYEASLKPMTKEELNERIRQSEEDVKEGRFIDIVDMEKW